jgi:hypothetical protein
MALAFLSNRKKHSPLEHDPCRAIRIVVRGGFGGLGQALSTMLRLHTEGKTILLNSSTPFNTNKLRHPILTKIACNRLQQARWPAKDSSPQSLRTNASDLQSLTERPADQPIDLAA